MKKKIKDLTLEECILINGLTHNCDKCPYECHLTKEELEKEVEVDE